MGPVARKQFGGFGGVHEKLLTALGAAGSSGPGATP
jgi:hypothetical protein